jgi:hypothetical protein
MVVNTIKKMLYGFRVVNYSKEGVYIIITGQRVFCGRVSREGT